MKEKEVGENTLDLHQVSEQFTSALQGRWNTEAWDIKRAKELGASDFLGGFDPDHDDDKWLTDFERVFKVMRCPDEDRIKLATFLLKGNAYHWWKTMSR